ncbi:unnamed protein product [Effrenium voratum]|uniref:RING-type domain-containing protein n=1 Tax=Effrenium voratum TaxID=2562239 RepID=A0AA36HYE8_9DINO|nr:unnamed protein product [Effrenium voratum]
MVLHDAFLQRLPELEDLQASPGGAPAAAPSPFTASFALCGHQRLGRRAAVSFRRARSSESAVRASHLGGRGFSLNASLRTAWALVSAARFLEAGAPAGRARTTSRRRSATPTARRAQGNEDALLDGAAAPSQPAAVTPPRVLAPDVGEQVLDEAHPRSELDDCCVCLQPLLPNSLGALRPVPLPVCPRHVLHLGCLAQLRVQARRPRDVACPLCHHGACPVCAVDGWAPEHDDQLTAWCREEALHPPPRLPDQRTAQSSVQDYTVRTFTGQDAPEPPEPVHVVVNCCRRLAAVRPDPGQSDAQFLELAHRAAAWSPIPRRHERGIAAWQGAWACPRCARVTHSEDVHVPAEFGAACPACGRMRLWEHDAAAGTGRLTCGCPLASSASPPPLDMGLSMLSDVDMPPVRASDSAPGDRDAGGPPERAPGPAVPDAGLPNEAGAAWLRAGPPQAGSAALLAVRLQQAVSVLPSGAMVHLPWVTNVLALRDGYIPAPGQEACLQVFGGLSLASSLDGRSEAFRRFPPAADGACLTTAAPRRRRRRRRASSAEARAGPGRADGDSGRPHGGSSDMASGSLDEAGAPPALLPDAASSRVAAGAPAAGQGSALSKTRLRKALCCDATLVSLLLACNKDVLSPVLENAREHRKEMDEILHDWNLRSTVTKLPNAARSKANAAKIIISDPKVGATKKYGLTPQGSLAASRTGKAFHKKGAKRIVVVSSDFSRARETAQLFAKALRKAGHICPMRVAKELRERRFGKLEGGPDSRYKEVWVKDVRDPKSRAFGAESAEAVQQRTTRLVARLDKELPEGADVVLVSHGDALQILQTAFKGISPAEHRSLKHLDRAELRELR